MSQQRASIDLFGYDDHVDIVVTFHSQKRQIKATHKYKKEYTPEKLDIIFQRLYDIVARKVVSWVKRY